MPLLRLHMCLCYLIFLPSVPEFVEEKQTPLQGFVVVCCRTSRNDEIHGGNVNFAFEYFDNNLISYLKQRV